MLTILVCPCLIPSICQGNHTKKRDPKHLGPFSSVSGLLRCQFGPNKNPPNSLQTTSAMVGLQAWPAEIKMPNQAPELQLVVVLGDVLQNVSKDRSSINYQRLMSPKRTGWHFHNQKSLDAELIHPIRCKKAIYNRITYTFRLVMPQMPL